MLISAGMVAPEEARASNSPKSPARVVPGRERASLPKSLRFEPNVGQADARVRFVARLANGIARIDATDIELASVGGLDPVTIAFDGASSRRGPTGRDRAEGVTNYLLGNEPERWRMAVPGYSRVAYEDLYPGVDLVLHGMDGNLQLDFDASSGFDAGLVRFRVTGARTVGLDERGGLEIVTPTGQWRLGAPRLREGRGENLRQIAGGYDIGTDGVIGFRLAARALDAPFGIAPTIEYSTFVGGAANDSAVGAAIGSDGSIYLAGATSSSDFPTPGTAGGTRGGGQDLYVTKLNSAGTAVVYTTFLGGGGLELAGGIDIDSTGSVYVCGNSDSTNFPTVNPVQATNRGSSDVVVAKLDPTGANLVYSTYLGGGDLDRANDIDADSDGRVVVGGVTFSNNYPMSHAAQASFGGGASDGFVSIVSADGGTLTSSTYVGGNGADLLLAVKFVDGMVNLGGGSDSTDLSFSAGPRIPVPGSCDLLFFLFTLDPVEATLILLLLPPGFIDYCFEYFTDLEQLELAWGLVTILVGAAIRLNSRGGSPQDVVCAAATPDGSDSRIISFGGTGFDLATSFAVDQAGNIWIAGYTTSADFPVVGATQSEFGGGNQDAFVARVDPNTFEVVFATYLGGSGDESATDIKIDADGNVIVVGSTSSADFPTTAGSFQPDHAGGNDAFIVRFPSSLEPDFSLSLPTPTVTAPIKSKGEIVVDIGRTGDFAGEVTVTPSGSSAIKLKLTPATASTTGNRVTFNYKVKKKATPGTYQITFTGRDREGRERSATLTLTITAA
ncbi:MAG: hypothetical protein IT175_12670 [Acidobacteria bacterium]|nr:hypothetical protein [Acidobacteriota bacterium]